MEAQQNDSEIKDTNVAKMENRMPNDSIKPMETTEIPANTNETQSNKEELLNLGFKI